MKKLILIFACLSSWDYAYGQAGCLCADIIILSDFSSSINHNEHVVTYSVKTLVKGIPPQDNLIRFALVSFGEETRVEVPLTSNYEDLILGVRSYEERTADGAFTNVNSAFDTALEIFLANRRNNGCFRIIIIVSDGQFSDMDKAITKANMLRVSTDYPIAIFSLSAFDDVLPIRVDDLKYLKSIPGNTSMLNVSALKNVSGGAYFGNDVQNLRKWIIDLGMCL